MMVALGSFGMSISFPTGPVIFTSAPAFKSPDNEQISSYVQLAIKNHTS